MRAAEIGLRVLANDLNVSFSDRPLELAQWQPIIDQMDAKIRGMGQKPAGLAKEADLKFYSEAASQFRYFKDGWRVRAAHARETFTEAAAKRVLDHVCDFFSSLSDRLSE